MQLLTIISTFGLLLTAAAASPLENRAVCPVATCDPSPPKNKCDITTSCIRTGTSGPYHCACRAGYKANGARDGDTSVQYRTKFVGQEYRVFVKPGQVCNQLCKEWWLGPDSCKEVTVVDACAA